MKFSAVALIPFFSLLAVAAASSSAVYTDDVIARDLVEEFGDDVVSRSEDGMLFRRFTAGTCLRTGVCLAGRKQCSYAGCKGHGGFPCAC
ncbi:hypothetical protein CPB83DRAFT_863169 [Crepidotus variabilis]|uniref:Uncharacterized protein n=1 Tax=Crepidotus variabilis TaxID=179855 RepID=A0A9P6E634_9AGAR|nr:hypothetical protein CPB83DRAFT_863169 [Crepidotus variabilis]